MVILLPDTGQFRAFEQSLDQPLLVSILNSLSYQQIDLTMPRFETGALLFAGRTLNPAGS